MVEERSPRRQVLYFSDFHGIGITPMVLNLLDEYPIHLASRKGFHSCPVFNK